MTDAPKAWIWSQYKAVVSEDRPSGAPLPFFGAAGSGLANRTKRGATLAAAMIVGLLFPKIAFLLLIFAGLMILSGLEPKRFEDFFNEIPGGGFVLRMMAIVDALIP
jgi:hypothetical protein